MRRDLFFFHGAESSEPHVQQHFCDNNAFIFEFIEQFFGKVQSRGRRGGRSFGLRVHGLVSRLIFEFFCDVRGERHFADPF